jgi:hypothetical protein
MGDVLAFPCRGRHRDILEVDIRDPEMEAIKALPEVQAALDNAKKDIGKARTNYLDAFAAMWKAEGLVNAIDFAETMLRQYKPGICNNE